MKKTGHSDKWIKKKMILIKLLTILSVLSLVTATYDFLRPSSSIIVIEDPKGVWSAKKYPEKYEEEKF